MCAKHREWGATHTYKVDDCDPVDAVMDLTGGRGVDVAIEAAWADHSVQQAADMARFGGRLVLVGIPPDDKLQVQAFGGAAQGPHDYHVAAHEAYLSTRAIAIGNLGLAVALDELVSHRYDLSQTAQAYASNAAYEQGINKVILRVG